MTINLTRFYFDPLEIPQDITTQQEFSSVCSLPACQDIETTQADLFEITLKAKEIKYIRIDI